MLVQFSVENFLSFNEPTAFSMVGQGEKIHPHHLIKRARRNDVDLQRGALIYGANASGKSNLIHALHYMQTLILTGTRPSEPTGRRPFKLNKTSRSASTRMEIDFRVEDSLYSYGFVLDDHKIHEEWLQKSTPYSATDIFRRVTGDTEKAEIAFGKMARPGEGEGRDFLKFVGLGTRPNQLFLCEARNLNVTAFKHIYNWFANILTIIFADSLVVGMGNKKITEQNFTAFMSHILKIADTGISDVSIEPMEDTRITEQEMGDLLKLEPGRCIIKKSGSHRVMFRKDAEGNLTSGRITTYHDHGLGREKVQFEADEESDGTQRLMDLIPAFFDLFSGQEKVYVVDELDRSIHPHLIAWFLKIHFEKANQNNQLIFTTHQPEHLDLETLRRGEIWFMEKNEEGGSELFSLLEFKRKTRYDKDVRNAYRSGRFGGVPRLGVWQSETPNAV